MTTDGAERHPYVSEGGFTTRGAPEASQIEEGRISGVVGS